MSEPIETDRVIELAEQVISGKASADDIRELEAILTDDQRLRAVYLRYSLVHGQLALSTGVLPSARAAVSIPDLTSERNSLDQTDGYVPSASWPRRITLAAVAATVLLAATIGFRFAATYINRAEVTSFDEKPSVDGQPDKKQAILPADQHYDNRNYPVHSVGVLQSEHAKSLSPTTLTVSQGTKRVKSAGGADVQIEGPAKFGFSSKAAGVLFDGSVRARLANPEATYSIQTASLRVVDLGTEFKVAKLDHNRIQVHVLDGKVEVQARVRRPLFHWSFDKVSAESPPESKSDDRESPELAFIGNHVTRAPGLVGSGAVAFDNQNDSYLRVETRTGTEVGTGDFVCSSGISIEALVVCRWSGRFGDYDEIFRKEDGNHRMLLSFQNDNDFNDFDCPEVSHGPCLSFGLHLEQHGYSELDMPLDGRDGRPNFQELTDGKPHHIVATYDSFTGRKAIYIDGRISFSHVFPVGTLILNGGPASAEIGNHQQREPFSGTIDEVAFYDFALSPEEIATHYLRAMDGQPYFPLHFASSGGERWRAITLVRAGTSQLFDSVTGVVIP